MESAARRERPLPVLRGLSNVIGCLLLYVAAMSAESAILEKIAFTPQPGSQLAVTLTFDQPLLAEVDSYAIEEPARVVLDLPGTRSMLGEKRFKLSQANATSVLVLESEDRTRVIINLVELLPFHTVVSGDQLTLQLGGQVEAVDVDAQDRRQQVADVLPGFQAVGRVRRLGVAGGNVEHPVRAKVKRAAVVSA